METKKIAIEKIVKNDGQIKGLKANPRTISPTKLDKLKASIQEDAALMDARPLMVIERDGAFVTIGGNMRFEACKQLGWSEVPCVVLPVSTDVRTLERYVLKDNASFGDWDFEQLKEWDSELLNMLDIELPTFSTEVPIVRPGEDVVGLPKELQGIDFAPDKLPSIQGSDETDYKRIIITYRSEQEEEVSKLLGLNMLKKVLYSIDELL